MRDDRGECAADQAKRPARWPDGSDSAAAACQPGRFMMNPSSPVAHARFTMRWSLARAVDEVEIGSDTKPSLGADSASGKVVTCKDAPGEARFVPAAASSRTRR